MRNFSHLSFLHLALHVIVLYVFEEAVSLVCSRHRRSKNLVKRKVILL